MNKNITPKNDKGQRHGYWQMYWDGELSYKCVFFNDKEIGFEEWYGFGGILSDKNYYL